MSLTLYTRARLTQVWSINLLEKQIKTSFWYNCALPPHSLIFWKNVFVYSVINRYKHELIQMNKLYNCFSYFSSLFFCLLFCFIIYILYILKFKGGGGCNPNNPTPDPPLSRSTPLQIRQCCGSHSLLSFWHSWLYSGTLLFPAVFYINRVVFKSCFIFHFKLFLISYLAL